MGDGVTPLQWSGNRYVEPTIVLEVAARYRTVFGLTADRFRIEKAVGKILSGQDRVSGQPRNSVDAVEYRVLRVLRPSGTGGAGEPDQEAQSPVLTAAPSSPTS